MKIPCLITAFFICFQLHAAPKFVLSNPITASKYTTNTAALCATAKETLSYLNKGPQYDPQVIHEGRVMKISLDRIKSTLIFICQHQAQLNDPAYVTKHFDFYRWYPDLATSQQLQAKKSLLRHLPKDQILMTKYYVHRARVATKPTADYPYALYAIPSDEAHLSLEQANANPTLTRFRYGKQAILKGALKHEQVPVLAYTKREDLEAALLQGTIVAEFIDKSKSTATYNVHRCNNVPYDKTKDPYHQDRFWYFKQVQGIKGYGKDADHKITVNTGVTFAADLEQFGLGKILMVQYHDKSRKIVTHIGILADTGGAFQNNLYQVDFLTGSYAGREAFTRANQHLPDYVTAYFMVLKQ